MRQPVFFTLRTESSKDAKREQENRSEQHDLSQVSPVTKSGAVRYNMTALMTAQTNNLTHVVLKEKGSFFLQHLT